MEDFIYKWISLIGFFVISFIAWITGTKTKINLKTILGSILLAWTIGGLTFWLPWTRNALQWLNNILISILQASQKGTIFLFGPLAISPGQTLKDGTESIGFILAMQVLPSVIFFSAVISLLYYFNIIQTCVNQFSKIFHKSMGLSGVESFSAATSIFFGIESCLAISKYLNNMTRSELMTLITCMMATVASTVMAIYVIALKDVFPQIAGHLFSASLISIPCSILISKLSIPETITKKREPINILIENSSLDDLSNSSQKKPSNIMVALMDGGAMGVKLAISIATLLIIVLGLQELIDLALKQIPIIFGHSISINRILSWACFPFTILIGLRPDEWEIGSQILASRFVGTEVTSYFQIAAIQSNHTPIFSLRSLTIMIYSLCGFVHIASLGIFVGGLTAIVPSRATEISLLGLRGLWTAFLATLLTGCIAGVLA